MIEIKPKDYAFLRVLAEADENCLTTKELRKETEKNGDIVSLKNSDINYRIKSLGEGSKNITGKQLVSSRKQSGEGSPKEVFIQRDSIEEVRKLIDEYSPSASVDDFSSYQEAMNYYIEQMDEARSRVDGLDEEFQSLVKETSEVADRVEEVETENEQLRDRLDTVEETVESHEQSLEVLRNQFRPVVEGMSKLLSDKMNFNPKKYIEK